ncbi:GABA receptor subunit B2-like protein, partial [Leptotrombidium deliense]
THNKMLTDLDKEKIEIALTQSVSEEITPDIQKFKESDVRIILGNFNEEWARYIFCQAYKLGITGRKYQWILAGEYRERWWNKKDASMNCTHSELMTALEGYIATDVLPLSTSHKITVSGMTAYEYHGAYDERRKHEYSKYHGYAYDGIWTIAFAIQYVNLKLSAKNRSLSLLDFDYRNPFWADLFREALNHTFFVGVTGNVTFEGNERKGSILVKRFEGGKEVNIGEYHSMTGELHLKPINWPGGAPPVDRTRKKIVASRVSLTLFIVISVFAVIGIILALVFLTMNIRYRKQSFTLLGGLIVVVKPLTAIEVINESEKCDEKCVKCGRITRIHARAWVLMTGFTLAFGSMFSKTWRVHAIFTNIKLNKKVIKDYKLFMVVGILVFIDVVTLTTWQIVDPFYRDVSLGSAEVYVSLNRPTPKAACVDH